MDESALSSLQNDVEALIEMGMNHQNQETFFECLNNLQSIPQFPFVLLKIISNQEISIPIRINAISLLRPILFSIDENFINDFLTESESCLFYALQIPFSDLVKEISILSSEIYQNFKKRTQSFTLKFSLNSKLIETIQIPEFVPNALIFAVDFASVDCYSISSEFASYLQNFVLGEHSEITIQLASLLTSYWELFEEKMIPTIFENVEELSINSIKYACLLIGNILRNDRPQILIDFIIQCIQNENDMIVFAAIESIYKNQMIDYQEDLLLSLYKRIGNDANLCECNVSTLCLGELKRRYKINDKKCHPYLTSLISASLESEDSNEIRCGIRCFSILFFENQDEAEKAMDHLSNYLNSEFCCDSSYSMTRITKKYPELFPQTFEAVFQVLSSDSMEVRYQVFNFLSYLSNKIEPMLPGEIKGQIQSEPYLSVMLEMIQNEEIAYEEFVEILKLIGSFCNLLQTFDGDNYNTLVEITLEILNKNSELSVECIYIFSSIISKLKEAFTQLFDVTCPIIFSLIENQNDDQNVLKYSLTFFSNAVNGASKFELLNDDINSKFNQVCDFALTCISQSSSFSIQKAGWIFLYNIILYDSELFESHIEIFVENLISIPSPTDLTVIGIKCQFAIVFIDRYFGSFNDNAEVKFGLIRLCYRGLAENEWDGSVDRQMCVLCLLRLALLTPEFTIDEETMKDISVMMEYHDDYIKDQRIFDEISRCLNELQNENEDNQEKEQP